MKEVSYAIRMVRLAGIVRFLGVGDPDVSQSSTEYMQHPKQRLSRLSVDFHPSESLVYWIVIAVMLIGVVICWLPFFLIEWAAHR